MQPTQIQVEDYLSYEDSGKVDLDNKTILVGENNAGKSNFVDAIREFFRFSNRSRQNIDSFYDRDQNRRIQITVWFEELTPEEKEVFSQGVGEPDDAELAVRLLSEYNTKEKRAETNDYQLLVDGEKQEWTKRRGLASDLDDRLPDVSHYGAGRELDDAAKTTNKSSLLYKLLGSAYEEISASKIRGLKEEREKLKELLNDDTPEPIEDLVEDLSTRMDRQVTIEGDLNIEFEIPTVKEMIQRNITVLTDQTRGDTLKDMGSGSQMSFVLACICEMADRETDDVFLTLEEPENYLHPHSIRQLHSTIDDLADKGSFVVLTTHSPELAGPRDLDNIRRVKRSNGSSKIKQPSDGLRENDIEVLETTESAETKEMFFSRSLIICEGPSDRDVLRIANTILGGEGKMRALDAEGVTVLHTQGKNNVPKYLRIADAFGIPTVAVIDTDVTRDNDKDISQIQYGTIRECRELADEFKMLENDLERELFEAVSLEGFHKAMDHLGKIGVITGYDHDLCGLRKKINNDPLINDKEDLCMDYFDKYDPSKPALGREITRRCTVDSFSGELQEILSDAMESAK